MTHSQEKLFTKADIINMCRRIKDHTQFYNDPYSVVNDEMHMLLERGGKKERAL